MCTFLVARNTETVIMTEPKCSFGESRQETFINSRTYGLKYANLNSNFLVQNKAEDELQFILRLEFVACELRETPTCEYDMFL